MTDQAIIRERDSWYEAATHHHARAEKAERERDEAIRRAVAAETELQRFSTERAYVVGWNDGHAAAMRGVDYERGVEALDI